MKMGNTTAKKTLLRVRRHARVRAKVKGTDERPRLAVFRSAKWMYGQIINDAAHTTLCAVRAQEVKEIVDADRKGKVARAYEAGKLLAQKAVEKKISQVVFDRGGYAYTGRVKAFADGARDGGLIF